MPGIITHRKVFQDSIRLLSTRKKKSYVLKSIETLLNSEEYMKAALFGVIGPDLFDYMPSFRQKKVYGHPVSFQLHDGGCSDFIPAMIRTQLGYSDNNNEWAAFQRAYIYGFISHYILDSFLNPFIFCWSGFPDNFTSSEIHYFRQQNLLFRYNIDNYYLYFDDKKDELRTLVNDFLPMEKNKRKLVINKSLKTLILETLAEIYPDAVDKMFFRKRDEAELHENSSWLDIIPRIMKLSDWMQHTDNPKAVSIIERLGRSRFFNSDFFFKFIIFFI